jgi:hypothetical protein
VSRERTAEPAIDAAPPSASENPLLPLLTGEPFDTQELIVQLRGMPAGEQTARWVDQLLDDPRVKGVPALREEAIRTLLEFGHPWALLINPEDLADFRDARPNELRPGRLVAGAVLSLVSTIGFMIAEPHLLASALGTVGIFWVLSVAGRALLARRTRRWSLMLEVAVGLVASTLALEAGAPAGGVAVLAAVLPVALAGLAGGWTEDP